MMWKDAYTITMSRCADLKSYDKKGVADFGVRLIFFLLFYFSNEL